MARAGKQVRQLAERMRDIDVAMLATVGPAGYLVSRPLSTQAAEFDGERVWFFVAGDSPKVEEIRRHPKVNLAYASKERNTYLSLAGDARVFRDQALIDAMWSDALKAYFPKGRTDPNLFLLEVAAHTIEYWDGPAGTLGRLARFVVARLTKEEEVLGENRLVDLRGPRTVARLPPSHRDAPRGARVAARQALATKKPAKGVVNKATKKAAKNVVKKVAKKATKKTAKKVAKTTANKATKKTR